MADNTMPPSAPPAKVDTPRLTGLKKRQQIEVAERKMFAWVVVAAVAISFCLATGQYLFSKWQYNNKVLGAKYQASDTLSKNIVSANALTQQVNSLLADNNLAVVKTNENDSNFKSILDALPTASDPAALATSLQQAILSRSGVTIESITVPPESDPSSQGGQAPATPQEMTISFIVSGSYVKIKSMLADLERTIRPIKIVSLNLTGTDANLRASIDAVTYYQPAKTVNAQEEVVK